MTSPKLPDTLGRKLKKTIKVAPAYAWKCNFGLCQWAMPKPFQLVERFVGGKPSPEAKPVKVALIEWADYRRLLKESGRF